MANIQIVINAINKASNDLMKVKNDVKGVGDAGTQAKGGVEGFTQGLSSLLGKAALVAGAVVGVSRAIKGVYEAAKEGAELEYARTRFDNLASSIGTVSDALMGDLRTATRGTVSDAELVASAGDLMALGLAKSHDEVVRLTSVAGALGMNMNQLVLALTNQTTARFDQLGVSVDGFDAKVKKLKETGLSASDAFKEAFLQQAEEQIEKVGNAADQSIGSFKRFEASSQDLSNAIKTQLSPAFALISEDMAGLVDGLATEVLPSLEMTVLQFVLAKTALENFNKVDFGDFMQAMGLVVGITADGVVTTQDMLVAIRQMGGNFGETAQQIFDSSRSFEAYTASMNAAGLSLTYLTAEEWENAKAAREVAEANQNAASATESVRDATNDANAAMQRYTSSLLFKIASEGLSSEGAYRLAEAMGLVDKNTVAATKQTNVYKQMLDSGMISQRQYNALIADLDDKISNLPEGKELTVTANTEEVMTRLRAIEAFQFGDKPARVKYKVDDSAVRGYRPPTLFGTVHYNANVAVPRAVGGAVTGGNPYNWQEYGYRGELFIPSVDGFVLSRADAERALARALYGGESAIDPEAIGKAIAKALSGITTSSTSGGNVYNLTMPTSSNPADVRTAFELMEAWA